MTRRLLMLALAFPLSAAVAKENDPEKLPTIARKTQGLLHLPGFFNLHWDDRQGILWLEVERLGSTFLYVDSLPAGVGSNDVGLDRGQLGESRIASFER